jgi:hypothetical protein
LNLWTYSIVLLVMKGIGQKMGSEKMKRDVKAPEVSQLTLLNRTSQTEVIS